MAYELGYRQQIGADASVSVSAFANDYADLKSIEVTPVTFIPIFWGNGMKGQVYGIEAWGSYDVADWWRLSGGLDWLQEDLGFAKGASGLLGKAQAGDDPQWRANLRSTLEIAENLTVDAQLRFQSALPNPHVPSYVELNARAGLMFAPHLALSLSGFNLLHASHQEYPAPADAIPRSVFLDLRWSP